MGQVMKVGLSCYLGPFSIPYLEAQVTWIFTSKSLDHFLFSLQVTWEPSHLAKSQVTLVADLEISWIAQKLLFVILYLFQFIYVTLYGMFYNKCTKGSQNSLHWWIMCSMPPAGLGSIPFFQFNSNSFTFNSNSNSFGMKNSNSNSNSFLSIPIPIPFYQFLFNSFSKPNQIPPTFIMTIKITNIRIMQ